MSYRSKASRFAVTLAAMLLLLYVVAAAGHSHANGLDGKDCQVCHAGFSNSLGPETAIAVAAPALVSWQVPGEVAPAISEPVADDSLGRSPPALEVLPL